jgi:hypothetical protein
VTESNRIPLKFSLLQLLKLVILCAAVCACIAPAVHLWETGVANAAGLVVLEGVAVPLVLATLGFLLIRRSSRRDRFITIGLLCSVSVAVGFAIWVLSFMVWSFSPGVATQSRPDPLSFAMTAMVALVLVAAFGFLATQLALSLARLRA